jgi:hypothetical protein
MINKRGVQHVSLLFLQQKAVNHLFYIQTIKKGERSMGTKVKQAYDPHLLYHAINVTVELEYKVPMQKVYDILVLVNNANKKSFDKISSQDVIALLKALGDNLEDSVMSDTTDSGDGNNNLQAKIKELLRLLGCSLSDQELNKILKGELSLDEALPKKAKLAWVLIFDRDDSGRYRPNKDMVEHMLWCAQVIAMENIEMRIQRSLENYHREQKEKPHLQNELTVQKYGNLKVMSKVEKERNDPILLDQKRNKLRLYIAHMQGYDKDRDRDGGRGIDMTTGMIIDFGDIYIADKSHGNVIEDIDRDGIDIADIK